MKKSLKFEYRNWKGRSSLRCVLPTKIYWGSTEYHKQEQWLMEAYDLDKKALRTFAVTDIIRYIK